uniref:HTH_48 domain-containing protein n=1 Tax=Heterorhabditis bacteriophora TaxID=37862 RepID=A0A1I7W6H3_HETBA
MCHGLLSTRRGYYESDYEALRTTIIHSHGKGEKKVAIAKNLCHENACLLYCETISRVYKSISKENRQT